MLFYPVELLNITPSCWCYLHPGRICWYKRRRRWWSVWSCSTEAT